jgi:three-Cys-motif partner protein
MKPQRVSLKIYHSLEFFLFFDQYYLPIIINIMPKDINSEEYDAGTKLKLEILSRYIGEWFQVIVNLDFFRTIYLYDFFAGSGTDSAGYHGSPIIMLTHLIRNCSKLKEKNKTAELLLNDNAAEKIEKLKINCSKLFDNCNKNMNCSCFSNNNCSVISVRFENKDFKILFPEEHKKLQAKINPYCFMFIDQYGIKEVDASIFIMLSSLKHTDILFFTATAHAKRFSRTEGFQKYLNFDDDFEFSEKNHRELCNHYTSLIPKNSEFHVAPFSIKKEDTGMICGLIFGSNNLYGIEKFLQVAWKIDNLTGEANYDIDDDDIRPDDPPLFRDLYKPKKLDRFEKNLKEYLRVERTNKEIYEFTLLEGFLPSYTNQILGEIEKNNHLKIRTISGEARKRGYYINHSEHERVGILYEQYKN